MMNTFPILNRPIHYNHNNTDLHPQGVVIHSTATPEATDENEVAFFDACNRNASAHYVLDYDSISRLIDEHEVAWHAGPSANRRFIGIELCEFREAAKFTEVWKRAVWLTADICKRYGFGVDKVFSHREISEMYHETDHTDPDGYFAANGKTWAQFKADVATELQATQVPKATQPQQVQLDPIALTVVIDQLKAMTKTASPDLMVAWNYAANAGRGACGKPITQDLGTPTAAAAGKVADWLNRAWHTTDRPAVQAVYAQMAVALRATFQSSEKGVS